MQVLRRCILNPIPELDDAVRLLDRACDLIELGSLGEARSLIRQADKAAVFQHAARAMGTYDDEVHRYRRPGRPLLTIGTGEKAKVRRPGPALETTIFQRDGHRCRYCGVRVLLSAARKALMAVAPEYLRWPDPDTGKHAAFYALTAVADHVVPH